MPQKRRPNVLFPPILYNPNDLPLKLQPIEQTEEYAADIRGMTMGKMKMREQHYELIQFGWHELHKKERCPRCHSAIRVRKPPPGGWKHQKSWVDDLDLDANGDPIDWFTDEEEPRPPPDPEYIAKLPDRIWVRPGQGVYTAKIRRKRSEPCDYYWTEKTRWPDEPGRWPKPGVLGIPDTTRETTRMEDLMDPTTNPWGLFKVQVGDKWEWRDEKTKNSTKHTGLMHLSALTEGCDFSFTVFEYSDQEWEDLQKEIAARNKGKCQSHPGKLVKSRYTCCNANAYTRGCVGNKKHLPEELDYYTMAAYWHFVETPWKIRTGRDAVVLDCEMGINGRGEQELVRFSAIDYYTGEVLIDSLVYPTVPMLHLNTRYSGVNWWMLNRARETKKCVYGRTRALERLCEFVGPATTLIMHGGRGDLLALRWIHYRVIDTLELEQRRTGADSCKKLSYLCKNLLGRTIQSGFGHDSLEDAIATRDLCHWYVQNLHPDDKENREQINLDICVQMRQEEYDREERPKLQRMEQIWLRKLGRIEL